MALTSEEQYEEAREADLARQQQWQEREREYEAEIKRQQLWHQRQQEEDLAQQKLRAQSRMGWGIFVVALLLSLIADAAEFFTGGTLGWFVGFIVDLILLAMLGLSTAGRKQFKRWIWGPAVETIPILSTFPFIRVGFLTWSFVSSRSTKLQAISQIATAGLAKKVT